MPTTNPFYSRKRETEIFNYFKSIATLTARQYFRNSSDVDLAVNIALTKVISTFFSMQINDWSSLKGFAFTIIKNTCISELRKHKTYKKHYVLNDDFYSFSVSCEDYDYKLDEQFDRVENKLRELPFEDQRIIRLKFEKNKSYREISHIINIRENSMGTRYSRVLSKLRSKLA
ncbi:MAG: sigma-70 family RNA polymerase sigma factor [Flavobacteriales bacterium]|nr:sigma-70 family RNA polymerase sigma factor [Flavobacteriales bacterium]